MCGTIIFNKNDLKNICSGFFQINYGNGGYDNITGLNLAIGDHFFLFSNCPGYRNCYQPQWQGRIKKPNSSI